MAVKTNTTIKSKKGKEYKYARITRTIGHKLDGSPIKKQFVGRSKSEAEAKADSYINSVKNGMPLNFESITLGYMLDDWLYNIKRTSKEIRSSSFDRYDCTYRNHLKDTELSGLPLHSITSLPIQRFYNNKYDSGTSENQIKEINKLLKVFFNWCVEHDYIKKNPVSSKMIELPGKTEELDDDEQEEISIFTDEEIEKIKNAALKQNSTYDIGNIVLLALFTGLREGEILALDDQNLDLTNAKVRVRKTLKKVKIYDTKDKYHWENKLQKPKTKTSIRTVDIPQILIPILKDYRQKVILRYKANNIPFKNDSLLFTTSKCLPIDCRNLSRAWERFLKRAGVAYRKFHTLRHNYASILFKNGANILEVKELLGHSDSKVTEKIYIHVCPQSKKKIINDIFTTFLQLS